MARPILEDDLWALIEPLPPPKPRRSRHLGRKPLDITGAQGIPRAVILKGLNQQDLTERHALVDPMPTICCKRGRPLSKPQILQDDRSYDHDKHRRPLHASGIATETAGRGQPHGSDLR